MLPPLPSPPQRPMGTPGHGVLTTRQKQNRTLMQRKGLGTRGLLVNLITNHFRVNIPAYKLDDYFYQYSVTAAREDGSTVEGIGGGLGRKIIKKLVQTYGAELNGRKVIFDGEHTLFTVGSLPNNNNSFTVVLEDLLPFSSSSRRYGDNDHDPQQDLKRAKRSAKSQMFNVEITFSTKIPMGLIANATNTHSHHQQDDALRVLNIILRQHADMYYDPCLLVRQSFFVNTNQNFNDVGGGVQACRGFSSSFHTTQSGLSLNYDVSTTVVIKAQSVLKFLEESDIVKSHDRIDWAKAERVLRHLRIKVATSQLEFKICGLSEKPCKEQLFAMKFKRGDEVQTRAVTVYDYFKKQHHIATDKSASLPCINVGKSNRPIYYPVQLCELLPLQRYKKALSSNQRSVLVDKTRQKPQDRKDVLERPSTIEGYNMDPVLNACGVSIDPHLTQVQGRLLSAPKLIVGCEQRLIPRDGRWNFMHKKLRRPVDMQRWAVVNFNAYHNSRWFCEGLIRSGRDKGLNIAPIYRIFEEDACMRNEPPGVRVEKICKKIEGTYSFDERPRFLLCFLPEKKNCNLYGPWKRKCLMDWGIITQCLAPGRVNDQYFTNLLLKINAKFGGINSELDLEDGIKIPLISRCPTMILGMDVSHGSPGQVDVPSIAAVASSREWPLMSRYRASVKTQPSKVEMIDSLCKPTETGDDGIIRKLLIDFRRTCENNRRPENIIIFRDGVSESQFNQVLNIELDQIIKACKLLDNDEAWNPKFMVIVAQKNHHTRFFVPNSPENVSPGTIIDKNICHPQNNDFYLCAHKGILGTSRPVHYHVLLDEIGFSPDELQELVHSLSYVYQRSSTAVSLVAPICYAHLAAAQVAQILKSDHSAESSSSNVEVPSFNGEVSASMFFC
ncbi:argonaute [Thalictrum thalictroides]|uniref:Argonaute n=1 Tax=Thalictrum thalictroides TaxID=46969 RepID=A0A7J6WJJ5_THATH|nr:argonaute [Thalictrum thalictroides]